MTDEHRLIDGTLYVENGGIIGRCTCGWDTGHRFSSMIASAAFADHKERVASGIVRAALTQGETE